MIIISLLCVNIYLRLSEFTSVLNYRTIKTTCGPSEDKTSVRYRNSIYIYYIHNETEGSFTCQKKNIKTNDGIAGSLTSFLRHHDSFENILIKRLTDNSFLSFRSGCNEVEYKIGSVLHFYYYSAGVLFKRRKERENM